MLKDIRLINDKLIEINKNNPKELKKYLLIKEILKDDNCFLKMDIEYAYSILRDLKFSEEDLKKVYLKLI
ncbi:MAG: hypothetical protein IKP98_03155 [Bacilli bacterium]|nr:hypothetical protein [Bacilli bacterium]